MQTILVPLDFSPHSERALEHAGELARALGARVVLAHAHHVPPPAVPLAGNIATGVEYGQLAESVREGIERECARRAEMLAGKGVKAEVVIRVGTPAEMICSLAEELPADLVVMGTRGRSGLAHVLLGSVAERTIRQAPCPVLTVKESDEPRD